MEGLHPDILTKCATGSLIPHDVTGESPPHSNYETYEDIVLRTCRLRSSTRVSMWRQAESMQSIKLTCKTAQVL